MSNVFSLQRIHVCKAVSRICKVRKETCSVSSHIQNSRQYTCRENDIDNAIKPFLKYAKSVSVCTPKTPEQYDKVKVKMSSSNPGSLQSSILPVTSSTTSRCHPSYFNNVSMATTLCLMKPCQRFAAQCIHFNQFHSFSTKNNIGDNMYKCVRKYQSRPDKQTLVLNPIKALQPHMAVPLLRDGDVPFDPSIEEVEKAQRLFTPGSNHDIFFYKSSTNTENLPQSTLPEVGFIGRSNVGKSTLIRAILKDAPSVQVKVSKTPGHTKLLNFFNVGKKLSLVDMPGYGYRMPEHYTKSVEPYLATRDNIKQVFLLIDSKLGITPTDQIGLKMMEEFGRPYTIVMTKIDKVSTSTLLRNLLAVLEYINMAPRCYPHPFMVSSQTGDGVAFLQSFIASVTGNISGRESGLSSYTHN